MTHNDAEYIYYNRLKEFGSEKLIKFAKKLAHIFGILLLFSLVVCVILFCLICVDRESTLLFVGVAILVLIFITAPLGSMFFLLITRNLDEKLITVVLFMSKKRRQIFIKECDKIKAERIKTQNKEQKAKDEQENKRKIDELTALTESKLNQINNLYLDLSRNEELVTIINNYYIANNGWLSFKVAETNILSKVGYFRNIEKICFHFENFDSSFVKWINSLTKDTANILASNQLNENLNAQYLSEVTQLFNVLCNQGYIQNDDEQVKFSAFLFLLYMQQKKWCFNYAREKIQMTGMLLEEKEEEIIISLHKHGVDEKEIPIIIWAVKSHICDYIDVFSAKCDNIVSRVEFVLRDYNEKQMLKNLLNTKTQKETNKIDIDDVDLMSGVEFENFVAQLFTRLGYQTTLTKASGDQGVDIIAKKGTACIAIQTKCYSNSVGNHAIMEVVAGAKYYNANKIMVITNNYFSKSAIELAKCNGVILWDRNILQEKLEEI